MDVFWRFMRQLAVLEAKSELESERVHAAFHPREISTSNPVALPGPALRLWGSNLAACDALHFHERAWIIASHC
jgi:hypothetical protein